MGRGTLQWEAGVGVVQVIFSICIAVVGQMLYKMGSSTGKPGRSQSLPKQKGFPLLCKDNYDLKMLSI